MASTTSPSAAYHSKAEWLCVIPDVPNGLEKRLGVRGQHLSAMKPRFESSQAGFAAVMLTAHPKPDEPLPMRGSVLVFHADTEAEVRKLLQDDIYTEAGVWDLSKVQIYPIKSGFRSAVPGSK